MDCNTEIKNVFVASENRDTTLYPGGNSYVLHLTTPIKDIFKVELIHASIPNTIYNLTDGANVLATNVGGTINVFSLTPGFYSATTLASEITDTISNISGISVQYISQFGKMLFYSDSTDPNFAIQTDSEELAQMLGIDDATPYGNVVLPSAPTGTNVPLYWDHARYVDKKFFHSERVVNLLPNEEGIFLDVEELRTRLNEDAKSITGDTYSGQNISRTFGMIPMDVNSGTIKRFKKMSDYDYEIQYPQVIRKLDRVTVRWTDRSGQLINFNGK